MDETSAPKTSTDGWLTRGQVAALLGIGKSTVRRMEERGDLIPVIVDGVRLFDPKQVDRFKPGDIERLTTEGRNDKPAVEEPALRPITRRDSPGKIAAMCFRLFEKGSEVVDVVKQLELTPSLVRALYEQWWSGNSEPTSPPPPRPAPRPTEREDREQDTSDERWREEMDRVYSAWERELARKWPSVRRPGTVPPRDRDPSTTRSLRNRHG